MPVGGAETLYKKAASLPLPLIEMLRIFKQPFNPLVDALSVTCQADPVYVKGRYIKLTRDVSQTPWTPKDDEDDEGVCKRPPNM